MSLVDPTGHDVVEPGCAKGGYSLNLNSRLWLLVLYGGYVWNQYAGVNLREQDIIGYDPDLNFNTADPDNYHNLSKGFEKFKGELDPLVKGINQTDRDIDRLVYKLYALTPEEIEIVEGRENPCED